MKAFMFPIHQPNGGPEDGGGGRRPSGGGTQPTPIPPFQAANYTFILDSFTIQDTRSLHEDSDKLSFSIGLDDGTTQTQTRDMGDLNNGDFPVGLRFGPIPINDPGRKVAFNYLIVNSGHQNWATVNNALTQTGNLLASKGAQAATTAAGTLLGASVGGVIMPVIGAIAGAALGWVVGNVTGILTADCDGTVAAEQVGVTGQQLWENTSKGNGRWWQRTRHPGTDSPWGCGSNSVYFADWTVVRS